MAVARLVALMGFTVLQCNRCQDLLSVVPSRELEWQCATCRHRFPLEAFRWVGHDLPLQEALELADAWNHRLSRGLSWSEAVEFKRMVPT